MAKKTSLKAAVGEIGFGSKSFSDLDRLILQDGTFNVSKKGAGWKGFSLYHWLINLHWSRLAIYGLFSYIAANIFFAFGYYAMDLDALTGTHGTMTQWDFFWHCFYFSTQTMTTVGYGFISPVATSSNLLAAFESMLGLLGFALATSILYGRFSKAKSKILFSDHMVVGQFKEIKGLKFRIANPSNRQLIEFQAKVLYSYLERVGADTNRRYVPLNLQIDFINMFPLPWTVVHPIEKTSPIFNKTKEDLIAEQAEFIVILKGYDDTFNQYVHQINSYRGHEILFDTEYEPMFDAGVEKSTVIDLNKINRYRPVGKKPKKQ